MTRKSSTPRPRTHRAALASTTGALAACFVLLTALVLVRPGNQVDIAAARLFGADAGSWIASVAAFVRLLAGVAPIVAALPVALALWTWHSRRTGLLLGGGYAASMVISITLKIAVNRPRPAGVLAGAGADEASFPSTSVVSCVVFWGFLAALVYGSRGGDGWRRRALVAVAVVLTASIGPSRLVAGDHWISDVVAGYLFGAAVLGLLLWVRARSGPT